MLPIRESKELRFREQALLLQPNIRYLEITKNVYKAMISCLFIPRLPVVETTNHAKPREYEKEICTKKTEDWRPNGIAATKVLADHRLLRRTTKGISIITANLQIGLAVCGGTGTLTKLKRD